jgi:hypothetical protein
MPKTMHKDAMVMHEQLGKMKATASMTRSAASALLLRDLHQLISLVANTARRKPKPTPALITMTQPETAIPKIAPQRRNNPVDPRRRPLRRDIPRLPLIPLLDQLPGDHTKHLLNALPILGTDLMATIPADILSPEATTALAIGALQRTRRRTDTHPHPRRRRRRRRLRRVQLLSDVRNRPLKRHPAPGRIHRNDIRLGPDNMDHDGIILRQMLLQLEQPPRHLLEALLVRDVVAEQTRVRAAVVQPRDTPEALLAGRVPDLETDDGVGGGVEDALGDEGGADGGRDGRGVKGVLHIALDERGFADSCTTNS